MGKTGPTGGKKSITKKTKDNKEYLYSEYGSGDENRESPPSTDLNDMDMELLRVAFASAKSKNAKKNNVEFMKQQKALVDAAREQAEVIKSAGNAHLAKIIGELDALCVPPDRSDLLAIATLIGNRREVADKLFESSTLSLEELAGSYDGAIQAAGEEFESRPARREKIRRHTIRQAHHILEQGVEEQKLITDATDLIQNFQRLMKA